MQEQIILFCATLLVFAESESVGGVRFGPNDCATLTRASTGSCLFRTDCDGEDISSLPFVMDCVHPDDSIVRHSFGQGGFDMVEEYDTEVKCARCQLPNAKAKSSSLRRKPTDDDKTPVGDDAVKPADVALHMNSARETEAKEEQKSESKTEKKDEKKEKKDEKEADGETDKDSSTSSEGADALKAVSKVAKYGPKSCVSTYRAKNGHCVMQTSCKGVDLSGYEFGLLCVEGGNKSTRHLFGQESFDDVETFDTLIRCEECLAVDTTRSEQAARGASGSSISTLTKLTGSLKSLTSQVTVMAGSLEKLEKKVFNNSTIKDQLKALTDNKTGATTATNITKAPAAAPSAAAPANKSLLHRHSHRDAAAPADKYLLRNHLRRARRLRHNVKTVRHHRSSATHEVKLTTAKAAKQLAMRERATKKRAAKRAAAAKYAARVREAKERAAKERAATERAKKERAAKEKSAAEKSAKEEAAKEQASKEQEADEEGEENTTVDESTEGASDSEQSGSAVAQSADEAEGSQEQGEEEKSNTIADESTETASDSEQSGSAEVQSTDEAEGSQEE